MSTSPAPRRALPEHISQIALLLQGGGALGAFQAGVYQGIAEAGYAPDWIVGTSIGGIQAAILAGNPPEARLERLRAFWDRITRAECPPGPAWDDPRRGAYNRGQAQLAMALGQPGFYHPRCWDAPWLAPRGTDGARSLYTVEPLRRTLEALIDFDRINAGAPRLSLGAVNVRKGRTTYFDSARQRIGPEHVLASAALPPAFPPVAVDGELYWDGGVVSNTPLELVIDSMPRYSTLCFMVDLFDAEGGAPANLEEVMERHKDISYASRSEGHIEQYRQLHYMRRAISHLIGQLPAERQQDPEIQELARHGCRTTMSIVHMIYRSVPTETHSKDYDFSRTSVRDHWLSGLRDARTAFEQARWLHRAPGDLGVEVEEIVSDAYRSYFRD
ncbi:patatin-like phospholipase family protein [Halorhodospira neutriphila]|uniref:PNPLA domain-containing protein n=1 Tax=Halorhodospira neutriphila TaxID=168379 RepID=A0ABS1E572_9GAMM|nr:patatin-like phospholipase family protein [Halorhodospira neutriphila]MBK1726332.1 hypothetical protein [Halorhodospira neutriphila]